MKMNRRNIVGIAFVEFLIYAFILAVIGGGGYQGYLFFYEWKCNKNLAMMNEAIEQYVTESRTPLTSLKDITRYIKGNKIPHCGMCPSGVEYLLNPVERKARCPYHGF